MVTLMFRCEEEVAQHPHFLLPKDLLPALSRSAAGLALPESCQASAGFLGQPGWGSSATPSSL